MRNKIELDEVELSLLISHSIYYQSGVSKEVSDTAQCILNLIKENPIIGRKELAEETGISLKTSQNILTGLRSLDLFSELVYLNTVNRIF